MTRLLYLICFAGCIPFAHAQSGIIAYGNENRTTVSRSGWVDPDGSFATMLYNENGLTIASFDAYGNTLWATCLGLDAGSGGDLVRLSNGNFFAAITQAEGNGRICCFSPTGTILWHKEMLPISHTSECAELPDGNIALLCRYGARPALCVLDPSGEVQWTKEITAPGAQVSNLWTMLVTGDQKILLVSNFANLNDQSYIQLTKTELDGTVIWERATIHTGTNITMNNAIQAVDGSIYVLGASRPDTLTHFNDFDLCIRKFDANGNYVKGRLYQDTYLSEGVDLAEDKEGGIIIIGNTKTAPVCGISPIALRIDDQLDTIWTKRFEGTFGQGGLFRQLRMVGNRVYVFGDGALWAKVGGNDGHLLVTTPDFELQCNQLAYAMAQEDLPAAGSANLATVHTTVAMEFTDLFIGGPGSVDLANGCTGELLSTGSPEMQEVPTLYPNPAAEVVHINGAAVQSVNVYDLAGKRVIAAVNDNELSVAALANGVYSVEIVTGQGIHMQKLVVKK